MDDCEKGSPNLYLERKESVSLALTDVNKFWFISLGFLFVCFVPGREKHV